MIWKASWCWWNISQASSCKSQLTCFVVIRTPEYTCVFYHKVFLLMIAIMIWCAQTTLLFTCRIVFFPWNIDVYKFCMLYYMNTWAIRTIDRNVSWFWSNGPISERDYEPYVLNCDKIWSSYLIWSKITFPEISFMGSYTFCYMVPKFIFRQACWCMICSYLKVKTMSKGGGSKIF